MGHEMGQSNLRFSRVRVCEWAHAGKQIVDPRLRRDVRTLSHRRTQHYRGKRLAGRTRVVLLVAIEAKEIFLEHQLAMMGHQQGVNKPGTPRSGISVDQSLHQAREHGFVHADVAGSGRHPTIAGGGRLAVDIFRLARRRGKSLRPATAYAESGRRCGRRRAMRLAAAPATGSDAVNRITGFAGSGPALNTTESPFARHAILRRPSD